MAEHLGHFFTDRYAKEVFDVQKRDEERHARFFARYAETVGLDDPRAYVSDEFAGWFEVRLPEAAARNGVEAVGLYHMILEGVVFTAGQYALLETARRPASRACRRGWSSCCATSAGTSASGRAAWPTRSSSEPTWRRSSTKGERAAAAVGARAGRAGREHAAPADGGGAVNAGGDRTPPGSEPALVFLHEGLGSVALWRDFPERARGRDGPPGAALLACGPRLVRRFRTSRARRASCTRRRSTCCRGCSPSTGSSGPCSSVTATAASIALIHASRHPVAGLVLLAPHVFVEDVSVTSIARGARDVRDHRPRRAHGPLPPRRRAHLPALERHLARARVPRLEHRGRARRRDRADAADPGRARPVRHARADRRDRARRRAARSQRAVLDCRHAPHLEAPEETLAAAVAFL